MLFWRPGPNLWFGVRLPWTLADPWIWNKSWRLASRLLMVMGVTALISWRAFFLSTAHLVGLTCLYTVILYRWKYGTWRFWKSRGWINFHPVVRCIKCGHFQKLHSHADLQGACEVCGAKLPDRQVGIIPLFRIIRTKLGSLGHRVAKHFHRTAAENSIRK
jgi:ribosomal protein S27E